MGRVCRFLDREEEKLDFASGVKEPLEAPQDPKGESSVILSPAVCAVCSVYGTCSQWRAPTIIPQRVFQNPPWHQPQPLCVRVSGVGAGACILSLPMTRVDGAF